MKVNTQKLLVNDKVNETYWRDNAYENKSLQDNVISALRNKGYTGTLNDMLQNFYANLTGDKNITSAICSGKLNIAAFNIDFVGKVKGDLDNTRLIYYGSNTELMNPDGFPAEANSAYGGVATIGDTTAWYATTHNGHKAQFTFHFDLTAYTNIHSIDVYSLIKDSTMFIYDTKGVWVELASSSSSMEEKSITLNSFNNFIDGNKKIKFGFIANTASNGIDDSKVEVDYFKLTINNLN